MTYLSSRVTAHDPISTMTAPATTEPESPLGVLRLRNRGMGTSGTAFQRFEADGRVYGHILDPRTGEPAEGPATVCGPYLETDDATGLARRIEPIRIGGRLSQSIPQVEAVSV